MTVENNSPVVAAKLESIQQIVEEKTARTENAVAAEMPASSLTELEAKVASTENVVVAAKPGNNLQPPAAKVENNWPPHFVAEMVANISE